ncbi:MAG: GldG family protein [Candidatus Hydrothermales bacterium]
MKKNKLYLACGVLALLNIFLLNIFLKNFVYRIDLSQKKIYTLHPVSKEVLRSLKDYLNIEVYMSSKLPAEMNPHKQDLFDLLEEYRNYSRGLLKYAVYYPDKNKDIELKVRRIGIPEITFNVVEKDQVKVVNGNFGLAIFYRDKKEIIPVITETENLEYDLTSKILKLIEAENIKTVGLLFLGQKQENYSLVRRELEKIFNIRILSLIGKIPDDVSVLLVFGNKKLTPKELYNLDQFIIRGGKVIFFLQPVEIDYEKFIAKPLFEKDLEFLKNYGIYLKPNIVKDPTIPFIPIMTGQRIVYVPYHYFVKIMPKGVKHHFARDLTQLVLFWPSAIDTLENKDKKFKYTTK